MKSLIESVALLTGLNQIEILSIAEKAPRTYRKYYIPKKRTGQRRIYHPSKETKLLQYAATDLLISALPVHNAAVGFIPGLQSPLKFNAARHSHNPYLLRVDFKDFFPSIRPADLVVALDMAQAKLQVDLNKDDLEFLERIIFVKYPDGTIGLPIGAPTSPIVSNAVMLPLDTSIQALADLHDVVYTRYADDLIFSTTVRGVSETLLADLVELLGASKGPRVTLNDAKTCFMSRNCRRAVTGLIITPDGEISIGRKNKRMLKALLCQSEHGTIDAKAASYLQGYLAFLLDVEPTYFNRLVLKYGSGVVDEALKHIGAR